MEPIDNDYLKRALAIEERAYADAKAAYAHHKDGENKALAAALEIIMKDEEKHVSLIKQMIEMKRPDTEFTKYIEWKFGEETTKQVVDALSRMHLPTPVAGHHYLRSNEGCIFFLNKYAMVVRVEPAIPEKNFYARVDSGCILQPLGSIDVGNAVVELCAGCHVERNEAAIEELKKLLEDEGLVFSDPQLENVGRLKTDNPDFPEGVLLVIDRLAVSRMKTDVKPVRNPQIEEARKEQERIFAPLARAFEEGLADDSRMTRFWSLAKSYATEGRFVAGWNEDSEFFDQIGFFSKTSRAEEVARSYSRLLADFEKKKARSEVKFEQIMGQADDAQG